MKYRQSSIRKRLAVVVFQLMKNKYITGSCWSSAGKKQMLKLNKIQKKVLNPNCTVLLKTDPTGKLMKGYYSQIDSP